MKKFLFGILLLLACQPVLAQVGPCPPGMSQYPGSNGIPSCGPLRSEETQPRGHWETRWGAHAIGDDGTTGWSIGQPDEAIAKKAAIENCMSRGGTHCTVTTTYRNGCLAAVNGDNASYPATSASRDNAIKIAMQSCKRAGENNCKLFRAECSPAKWIGN